MVDFATLLAENEASLNALAAHLDGQRKHHIDIGAYFMNREVALAARLQMIEFLSKVTLSDKRPSVVISMEDDEEGRYFCRIGLYAIPKAEDITNAELIVRQVADEFDGEQPGWDIVLPVVGRIRDNAAK